MGRSAPRPCCYPSCPSLVGDGSGYCDRHRQALRRQLDEQRGTSSERGYGFRWRKARVTYLRAHPLCVRCLEEGVRRSGTVVDHRTPHRGDQRLFWDSANWQTLCKPHHDEKTAREDGGFGRRAPGTGGG